MSNLSLRKFVSLSKKRQHAYAAAFLRAAVTPLSSSFDKYLKICPLLGIEPIPYNSELISDRLHFHAKLGGLSLKEEEFLPLVKTKDQPSNTPFLPIWIYLDSLRLAQNVGSIIRTTEAFRLGSIYFARNTPFIDQKKVKSAAMGADTLVPCTQNEPPFLGPFIGLETVASAKPINSYCFPPSFTLVMGNEEYGISEKMLSRCDDFVQIPLMGQKNSINVACAFAIAAAYIRSSAILN